MKTTNLIHSGLFRMAARGYIAKPVRPQLHDNRQTVVWGLLTWPRLRLSDALLATEGGGRYVIIRVGFPLLFH